MAKKRNKVYVLKRSKIKKAVTNHDFKVCVMIDESGKAIEAAYDPTNPDLILVRDVLLNKDSKCVKGIIKFFEDLHKIRLDKEEDMKKDGLRFSKKDGHLILYPSLTKALCEWKLCVDSFDMGVYLFTPFNNLSYYNIDILQREIPDIVKELLDEKIIKAVPAEKIIVEKDERDTTGTIGAETEPTYEA